MDHYAPQRAQHEAALTYLDDEVVALADLLAEADEEPAERGHVLHTLSYRRHALRRGACTAALTAAGFISALVLAPATPAHSSSPFDTPTYHALDAHDALSCAPFHPRVLTCTSPDGATSGTVEAIEGAGETTYSYTLNHAGHVAQIQVIAYADPNAVAVIYQLSAMRALPTAYPNRTEGAGWAAWGTDAGTTAHVVSGLPGALTVS